MMYTEMQSTCMQICKSFVYVLCAYSFASNRELLFLNPGKRKNGHRNVFMTKSPLN